MPLLLPDDYPARTVLAQRGVRCLVGAQAEQDEFERVRIGIINLMPAAEAYEPMLLAALGHANACIEPVWLRLQSHSYASSDLTHLERFYSDASEVLAQGTLDGLILTGAPVEELAFSQVRYWSELLELLTYARARVSCTLGLCWGGMALAKLLEIEKDNFEQKLFGVYPLRSLSAQHPLFAAAGLTFSCAQSRHSGTRDSVLEAAERARVVRLLAHSDESGYSIFESHDARFQMHLGHPEYAPVRLCFEYLRDRELGRGDVTAPHGVELEHPSELPLPHGLDFFARWVAGCTPGRPAARRGA